MSNKLLSQTGSSPAQLLAQAMALQKAGKRLEAEDLLTSVTQQDPANFAAWFNLAVMAEQKRDWQSAAGLFARAAEIDSRRLDVRFRQAIALTYAREPASAETILREHLERKPRDAHALNLMGVICRQTGRLQEAVTWLQKALKVDKGHSGAHHNLGRTHSDLGDFRAAATAYREVLKRQPKNAESLSGLGWCQHRLGNAVQGLATCRQAIAAAPNLAAGFSNCAAILFETGRYAEALIDSEQAIKLDPRNDHALNVHATILSRLGRVSEATAIFQTLLEMRPDDIGALLGLGNAYFAAHDLPNANDAFRRAVAVRPDEPMALARLCRSLLDSRYGDESVHMAEASAHAHRAIALGKPLDTGFSEFQSAFQRTADFDGLSKLGPPWPVLERTPSMHISVLHNQLSQVVTAEDRRLLVALHRRWGERLLESTKGAPIASPAPVRRSKMRIGLLSSDLRSHAITYFTLPIIEHYDRDSVELYCYSFYPGEADPVQQHIAGRVDSFKLLLDLTNQAAAQIIVDDRLDMLFELGGSTKHNRLDLLGYRMAPAQASWLGYPHSAGLPTIDYILVDPYLKPQDPTLLIERPFEVPESWVSFGSFGFPEVPIVESPPLDRNGGRMTFGTMNSPYKYTAQCIAAWARVLSSIPGSRFLFVRPEAKAELFRANIVREFAKHGIPADRLAFIFNTRGQHHALYNEIDIALDTFPQTGGTTTCETMWMGVPVVTLVGEAFFERLSYSNLSNAGLGDLCAVQSDDYVARAQALAGDVARIRDLRRGLREQVRRSPLGQTQRWVRNFESVARQVSH